MRTRINSPWLAAVLLAAALPCGGCQWAAQALGFEGSHLLVGQDTLALPGEEVQVEVRFRRASLFWEPKPTGVYLFLDGNVYHAAKTDSSGAVTVPFRPTKLGDYLFHVECRAEPGAENKPLETDILVACREANRPLFVADIDRTLCCGPSKDVLFGEPNALADSAPLMRRLAKEYSVVYLTRRWDYLGKKTRQWLRGKGFPEGPIFAARGASQVLEDNEKFKAGALAGICGRFHGGGFGIGDHASDVRAYERCGLRGILIVTECDLSKSAGVREATDEAALVPESANVVLSWTEAEKVVFDHARFSPSAAIERLKVILLNLEARK